MTSVRQESKSIGISSWCTCRRHQQSEDTLTLTQSQTPTVHGSYTGRQ